MIPWSQTTKEVVFSYVRADGRSFDFAIDRIIRCLPTSGLEVVTVVLTTTAS